jgi:CRISPR-associated protein Csb1
MMSDDGLRRGGDGREYTSMDYEALRAAVAGDGVAIRVRRRLQPAEGAGSKVFPPTYTPDSRRDSRYAVEQRQVEGRTVTSVLLDSVASQANRQELALLDAWERKQLTFPVAYVDFSEEDGLADLGQVSDLEAPHRIADAIFRDSMLDGTLFRLSDLGRAITDASPRDATALFVHSPTALLFGMWDSTGPKGGLGSKFQRAIASEIVGIDAVVGVKVGSRIDPLAIERDAAVVYRARHEDDEWTLDPDSAATDTKGKPVKFNRSGAPGDPGRPSNINHGNIAPSVDGDAGGVTFDYALQTIVLSFAALRKLRFVTDPLGQPLASDRRLEAEIAARTCVAALGLAAIVYQHEADHDLRSRCLLVAQEPLVLELLSRNGASPTVVELSSASASQLVLRAAAAARDQGLGWREQDLRLTPAPKLVELIRRSRDVAARQADE